MLALVPGALAHASTTPHLHETEVWPLFWVAGLSLLAVGWFARALPPVLRVR